MSAQLSDARQEIFDRAGILFSGICLIHCTILPFFFAALQSSAALLMPTALSGEFFHLALAFLLLGTGGIAFVTGYLRHGKSSILCLALAGTTLLFLGAFNPREMLSGFGESAITTLATVSLIFAHWKNQGFR